RASSGTTYFFKSKLAYEYDEYEGELKADTPRAISKIFSGIPTGTIVTGAFTGVDGYGYLISGKNYYIVNPNMKSDGEINNFAQDFLRCPQ
uniref:hemopexin repeat-containing protein n=1 Tax=Salmonella sp. s51944 TaxID=3159655 RepID=UPI003980DD90